MKKRIFAVLLFTLLLFPSLTFAAQVSSGSYKQNVIVSEGGQQETSSSYKLNTAVDIINGIINSASYINKLGFFHILLLADGQACTSANQCEGGFCCSSSCSSSSCPSGGGGGGGGGAAAAGGGGSLLVEKVTDFSVTPSSMHEQVPLGATKTNTIAIKNTGNTPLSFSLSVATINDILLLSDTSFSLDAGLEKDVQLSMTGKQLGSYFGEIKITAAGIEKSVTVIVDVQSTLVLFDVKIDIPTAYKEVAPGSDLKAQITLFNVGTGKQVDVTPTYIIKDRNGNVIYESSETFAVEKQKSYVKTIRLPKNIKPDDYLAVVELRYENSFAVSSELFKVVQKEAAAENIIASNATIIFVFIIFIGLVSLFVYMLAPKLKFPGNNLNKLHKIIDGMEKAVADNDVSKAKEIYIEVKKLYTSLKDNEKKEISERLKSLHIKIKNM